MIDITHQHARRLLRKHLDTRLPEAQWSVLQAHLEGCAECRAYRERLRQSEKSLRRALRGGWDPVNGPLKTAGVARDYRGFLAMRQRLRASAVGLAALLAFVLLGGPGWLVRLTRPAPPAAEIAITTPVVTPESTAAPTARAGEFPEVVVYEDHRAGNAEIFLLNPGAEPDNLTENPAEDTAPAWSPDGAWIAFLSDRAGGRAEVFVTDLTGRVVQLTSQPGVRWEGPISWSPDGRYLALTGIREEEGGQRWIYQVGLDGSGARPLPGTRGGSAPKYARFGGRMAFNFSGEGQSGLVVYHVESGAQSGTSWPENALAPQALPAVSFDWSRDGGSLVYIAAVPLDEAGLAPVVASTGIPAPAVRAPIGERTGSAIGGAEMDFSSQIMAMRVFRSASDAFFGGQTPFRVAASRWPSAFRSVSWTPARQIVYLEDLGDARARPDASLSPECWQIHGVDVAASGGAARRFTYQIGGLCVEGGFDSGSWTPDGDWMVVRGRVPGEREAGLFAVHMTGLPPERAAGSSQMDGLGVIGTLRRLTSAVDAPPQSLPRVRPRLLVSEEALRIDPQPVKQAAARPPVSDLSKREGGPSGQLVYVVQNGGNSVVAVTNPDGAGGRVLYASQAKNRCPAWSPDGRAVALVSRSELGREGIYLLDAGSQGAASLHLVSDGPDMHLGRENNSVPVFGCPVWSPHVAPGGPSLAVTVSLGGETLLGILPTEGGQATYAPLEGTPAGDTLPVWSGDGRTVFVALRSDENGPSRVATLTYAPETPGAPAAWVSGLLEAKSNWGEIRGMTARPGAPYLMLVTVEDARGPARLSLRQVSAANGGLLPRSEPAPRVLGLEFITPGQSNHLALLPAGGYGLVMHGDPRAGEPDSIVQYLLTERDLARVAAVDDPLYEVQWSPDGRWLVYTTESGLWGLDAAAASVGRARPVWLSPVVVQDIDWR